MSAIRHESYNSDFSRRFTTSVDAIQEIVDDLRARLGKAPLQEELLVEILWTARAISEFDVAPGLPPELRDLLAELRRLLWLEDEAVRTWCGDRPGVMSRWSRNKEEAQS